MIGTLLGGLEAVRAAKRSDRLIDDELRRALARRNRTMNENPTRRSDASLLLNRLDESLRNNSTHLTTRAAVAGLPEGVNAATRRRNANTLAAATAHLAAEGTNRREKAEADYDRRVRELRELRLRLLGTHATESVLAGSLL